MSEEEKTEEGVQHLEIEDGGDTEELEEAVERAAEEAVKEAEELAKEGGEDADAGEDFRDKYTRLYAEFENYKKRMAKDKTELIRYGNESLIADILPSIDNLETAIEHAGDDVPKGLVQGIENSLKELARTLEKFGLKPIEALGEAFNPEVHHAVAQVERTDLEDKTVAEEMRKGYMYGDKVIRASMVVVSRRPDEETERYNGEDAGEQ